MALATKKGSMSSRMKALRFSWERIENVMRALRNQEMQYGTAQMPIRYCTMVSIDTANCSICAVLCSRLLHVCCIKVNPQIPHILHSAVTGDHYCT
jgi:hypothetical protein